MSSSDFVGGSFNRSAVITYQKGGLVVINQRFFGHDALNNIRMDTYINGTVPIISNGEKVSVDEYKEEYRRVAPGKNINFISDYGSLYPKAPYEQCGHASSEVFFNLSSDQPTILRERDTGPRQPNDSKISVYVKPPVLFSSAR